MKNTILVMINDLKMFDVLKGMGKFDYCLNLRYSYCQLQQDQMIEKYKLGLIYGLEDQKKLLNQINEVHKIYPDLLVLIVSYKLKTYDFDGGEYIRVLNVGDYENIHLIIDDLSGYESESFFCDNNISLDMGLNQLNYNNNNIILTEDEAKLFKLFFTNKNRTFSKDDINKLFYDDSKSNKCADEVNYLKYINQKIERLRKKVGFKCIRNIYNVGYKWNEEF
ncbi:MAG: helix-turn-helix domain-containing protein [Bacilli bacterium]|jgi:DNA-binding winged helix-turn-helix (wHTH) protein|nr:helix-turn-helix domain-containing protein [Bacilli bacterium]